MVGTHGHKHNTYTCIGWRAPTGRENSVAWLDYFLVVSVVLSKFLRRFLPAELFP